MDDRWTNTWKTDVKPQYLTTIVWWAMIKIAFKVNRYTCQIFSSVCKGRQILQADNCLFVIWNLSKMQHTGTFKGKATASHGSKFFPLHVDPIEEKGKYFHVRVTILECVFLINNHSSRYEGISTKYFSYFSTKAYVAILIRSALERRF